MYTLLCIDSINSKRHDFFLQVNVQYNCGRNNYCIHTPWRKSAVRRSACRKDLIYTSRCILLLHLLQKSKGSQLFVSSGGE